MLLIIIKVVTIAGLWLWVVAHQLAIYYFFSVAVDQLPKPSGNNGFYSWFFGVLHFAAANWNRARMGLTVKSVEDIKGDTKP